MIIHNRLEMKTRRKELRHDATPAEQSLWRCLRNRGVVGAKFRRQHSIGVYVIDFYCPEVHLALEIDGDTNGDDAAEEYDGECMRFLATAGITVLRISSDMVNSDVDAALDCITQTLALLRRAVRRGCVYTRA